jgi:hypothetical protein
MLPVESQRKSLLSTHRSLLRLARHDFVTSLPRVSGVYVLESNCLPVELDRGRVVHTSGMPLRPST